MLIGAHVGVSGGYPEAVEYARSVGAECMQVFCKSPRQWRASPLHPAVATAFRARVADTAMGPVFVHTAYLINLGTPDPELWERSIDALAEELRRSEALGATAAITHLGTAPDGPAPAAARIAAAIDDAFERSQTATVRLLLENTAGAGSTYGDSPTQLASVLGGLTYAASRVGVCLDTCHAHAAGWDLSDAAGWKRLLRAFEEAGIARIETIHANDCAYPAGDRKDRHAWIGDGTIGTAGFAAMVCEPRLAGASVITEMPGEVPFKDAENISRLVALRDSCAAPDAGSRSAR